MPKYDGRFKTGERRSIATEFKRGEHWRPPQAFREKGWLEREYLVNLRSAKEIAVQFSVHENAIFFWLAKHGIPRRSVAEARAIKHWGSPGEANGMFGKRGAEVPNWQGGISPERAACYSSIEWSKAVRVVWKRDCGTCQRCSAKANDEAKMHIHHIVGFAVKELRAEPTNLVLLCIKCHHFVHSKRNKEREFLK